MDRILRIGSKGDDVGVLEQELAALGFAPGPIDNYFGPKVLASVKALQKSNGLTADGVVGANTRAILGKPPIVPAPVAVRPIPIYKSLAQIDARFEKGTAAWYQAAYLICDYDPGTQSEVAREGRRLLVNKAAYQEVEKLRGIPWDMIASIHHMECNNNMKGVLHNGELIVGTNRKTKLVPAGLGPFATWLDAALDAIDHEPLWKVPNWSVGYMLKQMELFNGGGYLRYHHNENSPYIWACTNINDGTGKYIRDGVWSETADANTQVGGAAILKWLEDNGEASILYA